MSGEELKSKLESVGVSQAKIAEMIGVFPQSFNKTLQSDDVRSGLLEDLCRVLDKDISFFYGGETSAVEEKVELEKLRKENAELKNELERIKSLKLPNKDSKIYSLWMKFMEITSEWQEMYKEEKGG